MESSSSSVMPDSEYASALYAIWTVQDTLLQYYRTMFLTAESLLIAVTASIAGVHNGLLVWAMILVGMLLLAVWVITTQQRARNVRFVQALLEAYESGKKVPKPFTALRDYQNKWFHNGSYEICFVGHPAEQFNYKGVWPPESVPWWKFFRWGTRIHMEISLPGTYLVGWLLVGIYAAIR